jgi:putative Mg2+ transporter-C (MgtC) family protein
MPSTLDLLSPPSFDQLLSIVIRLAVAAGLGALIGADRESVGKAAGLRTHMLVALGAALFVIVVTENGTEGDVSRVIQGVAAGIGFLGAGTILKQPEKDQVSGLTTAASVWLTAAIGVAAGVGTIWLSIVAGVGAWLILRARD